MDQAQIAYFQGRYSRMSDEELATLYVTRREVLSEEAVEALRRTLDRRNVPELVKEINAKVRDLNAQAAGAAQELERQRATNRQIPRAMLILFVATLVIFGAAMLVRQST